MPEDDLVKDLTLDLTTVEKVYIGEVDRCMCGCAGNYFEDDTHIKAVYKILRRHCIDKIYDFTDHHVIGYIVDIKQTRFALYLKD